MARALPEKIGRYEVKDVIGEGGQGLVYRAYDPVFMYEVAVKEATPRASPEAMAEAKERIVREARAARQASDISNNIATLRDFLDEDGHTYLVYEYVEGDTLRGVLKKDRSAREKKQPGIPLERKIRIVRQMAAGLSKAHELEIIHRDIKPDNVKLTSDGIVKILDFGLARVGNESSLTSNRAMGTPNYMSPEQWGTGKVTHHSDIWACGVILFEMLADVRPFEGDPQKTDMARVYSIMRDVTSDDPTPPLRANVPDELKTVVARALEKDPAKRYQQIDELDRDLEAVEAILERKKEELVKRLQKEAAEFDSAVSQKRGFVDRALAHEILDPADPVDKRLWLLFAGESVEDKTVTDRPAYDDADDSPAKPGERSYSGILFELERLAQQRERLDDVVAAARTAQTHRDDVQRLRDRDEERDDPFDDVHLRNLVKILEQAVRVGRFPEARALLTETQEEISRRGRESELVEQARGLRESGELKRAVEVLESPPGPVAERLRREIRAELKERQQLTEELQSAAAHEKQGNFDSALQLGQKVSRQGGSRPAFRELVTGSDALVKRVREAQDRERLAAVAAEVRTKYEAAKKAVGAGDDRGALRELDALLQLDPSFESAKQLRAQIMARLKRLEAFSRAKNAEQQGQLQEVLELARSAMHRDDHPDYKAEVEALAARVKLRIENAERAVRKAEGLQDSGRLDEAQRYVRKALEVYPGVSDGDRLARELEKQIAREQRKEKISGVFQALWKRRGIAVGMAVLLLLGAGGFAYGPNVVNWVANVMTPDIVPPPPVDVWVDVSPWAEIEWVRRQGSEDNEVVQETQAPCWLNLPPGEYEIAFKNHVQGDSFVVPFTVSADGSTTVVQQALPGFAFDESLVLGF